MVEMLKSSGRRAKPKPNSVASIGARALSPVPALGKAVLDNTWEVHGLHTDSLRGSQQTF